MSKFETMRRDPANWKLRIVYYCADDPRIIVRNLLPFGWTWNFAHPKVYLAIVIAAAGFLAPPYLAWQLGIRSGAAMGFVVVLALTTVMIVASCLARDPEGE